MTRTGARQAAKVAAVFHALGDPTRRAIVERLSEGPRSATVLAAPLGITVAAVVQHLAILEEGGLIRSEKAGRIRTCRLEAVGLAAAEDWIRERRALWESRLDRLKDVLEEGD